MIEYKNIIWDWNGTLLDDIDLCINAINTLLKKRKLKTISIDYYKEIFAFPVVEYYKILGFDFSKETFQDTAFEFIDNYQSNFNTTKLHTNTINILDHFKTKGTKQYILSAMEQKHLEKTVGAFNITEYFDELIGIKDHYAFSKVEFGEELIKRRSLITKETLLIGDTIHDYEVAQELGISCILITNGHQSKERLMALNSNVLDGLNDLKFV